MEPSQPDPAPAGFRTNTGNQPTILIEDAGWRRLVPDASRLAARAAVAAGGAGTVVLSSDRAVRALNALHRRRDQATNVLTFDLRRGDQGRGDPRRGDMDPGPAGFLGGDIVLALGTVRREAAAAGRPVAHHLAHLVVHGALHLRGHDHHHVGDARRMEMEEARILQGIGVPNPWKRR